MTQEEVLQLRARCLDRALQLNTVNGKLRYPDVRAVLDTADKLFQWLIRKEPETPK